MADEIVEKELWDHYSELPNPSWYEYKNNKEMKKAKAKAKLDGAIAAYPDAKKHQIISFIKSGIRILGYALIPFNLLWATAILILSEVVGIIEELV